MISSAAGERRAVLSLELADGSRIALRAAEDPKTTGCDSTVLVRRFALAMGLGPASGPADAEVLVADAPTGSVPGAVCCDLSSVSAEPASRLWRIGELVAHAAEARGALLVHGALAVLRGEGVLLAGPGSIGKTTASRRLPEPWCSLSDDAALVVPSGNGGFRAHPWPTWSRFLPGGPGGTWRVAAHVPLRAIFFLDRAPSDRVEPLGRGHAAALVLESSGQICAPERWVPPVPLRETNARRFANALAIASTVPAYQLHLSPDGPFWREIEPCLAR